MRPGLSGFARSIVWAAALSFWSVSGIAGDWPQWRGPEATGVSTEKGVPIVWHEERSIVWKCPLPPWGTSTPAIWGSSIFVTTHTADEELQLLCIDKPT